MTHQCATRTADVSPTTNANRWGNTHRDGAARCPGSRPARAAGRSHRLVAGVARPSHRGIGAHPAGAHAVRAGGLLAAGGHHRHAWGTGASAEESRVGQERVSAWRSSGSPVTYK